MTTPSTRRLIEDWLPINAVSAECIRERKAASALPPINWLHVWWARRPLAISRAAVAAALLRAEAPDAMQRFYDLMGTHPDVADEQRRLDQAKITGEKLKVAYSMPRAFTHNITSDERKWFHDNLAVPDPVVLDVTAGGGSIPFEAGRLGLETEANELNPVAALILQATCRWPQKYGLELAAEYESASHRLLERVRELVTDNAVYPLEPELDPDDPDLKKFANQTTVRLNKYVWAYLFSRTVRCPSCGNLIPLSPNWRLDDKGKGIRLLPDESRGVCDFEIVDTKKEQSPGTFVPKSGQAECPYPSCGATTRRKGKIAASYIAQEAQAGRLGHQAYCVVVKCQWQKLVKGQWRNIRTPKGEKPVSSAWCARKTITGNTSGTCWAPQCQLGNKLAASPARLSPKSATR